MKTVPLTLHLPNTEIRFLEEYTRRHQTSIAELFDRYIKHLQQHEQYAEPMSVDRELARHTGIIPAHIDVAHEYYRSREEKHR